MFKIGTLADWFGLGLIEGIRESRRCGAEGVQLYAAGELDPRTISSAQIRRVRDTARDCRQTVAAVCGELGGYGLERAEDNAAKLAYLKKVVELGAELDCHVVTTHIGVVPADRRAPRYAVMREAMQEIGEYAASFESVIAVETGPEPIETLAAFIDDCGRGLGINYDPANIVMVTGVDHVAGVGKAGARIVHTHAKDGVNLRPVNAEEFYHNFAEGGLEWMRTLDTIMQERPLGQGDVRWPAYLQALKAAGYDGFLTIEREAKDGSEDIRAAVRFLEELIGRL
ncbi:MAG: sugar phosphate isomerase/epimerase [Clostridia bacterium]|nr:sugar phosphate isomerase/epimerase [Clostridia bacterium]